MARVRSVDLGGVFLDSLEGVCEMLLVRHGEQDLVPNMALERGIDAPLTELGRRQAAAVGERLATLPIDAVHSSTMQRALHTGEAVAGHHGLDVQLHADLVEVDLWRDLPQGRGLLDSVDEEELRTILRDANRSRRWDSYPYGEPRDDFRQRIVTAMESIAHSHEGQRVVIACHGGVINAYLSHLWGSDVDQLCTIHHTGISTVRASGEHRRVVQVNDYSHVLPFQAGINPMNAA